MTLTGPGGVGRRGSGSRSDARSSPPFRTAPASCRWPLYGGWKTYDGDRAGARRGRPGRRIRGGRGTAVPGRQAAAAGRRQLRAPPALSRSSTGCSSRVRASRCSRPAASRWTSGRKSVTPVPTLSLRGDRDADAVTLFAERARAHDPEFARGPRQGGPAGRQAPADTRPAGGRAHTADDAGDHPRVRRRALRRRPLGRGDPATPLRSLPLARGPQRCRARLVGSEPPRAPRQPRRRCAESSPCAEVGRRARGRRIVPRDVRRARSVLADARPLRRRGELDHQNARPARRR